MNRQLKFREWLGKEFHYWGFMEDGSFILPTNIKGPQQQMTGLLDKNRKEIYEGDIVRLTDGGDVSHHRIYFDDKSCRWMDERLEDGDSLTCYDEFAFVKDAKVIGNIYENPDLLKQKEGYESRHATRKF